MARPAREEDGARDLMKGTLDMLILKALDLDPMHGWGIADRIEVLSRGVFRLQTGTLYPALHRLLRRGWVAADWRITTNARRARYYRLTAAGRKRLDAERQAWDRGALAVRRILDSES
jgi:transcriptional regulator